MKRVFNIDIGEHGGGILTIIAAILDPTVIAKILAHPCLQQAGRLAYPGTAPITGAAIRITANDLISSQFPHHSRFSSLSRQPCLARTRARHPNLAPRADAWPGQSLLLDRDLA